MGNSPLLPILTTVAVSETSLVQEETLPLAYLISRRLKPAVVYLQCVSSSSSENRIVRAAIIALPPVP